MPRQDVPYGGAICRLKERIAEIWDKLDQKLHSINGVEGDGAGNVEIVSGDAAVLINNDQIGHRIEVSLDKSKLPSAAVSSVNGQTGAVWLNAADIPSDGNSNVQADLALNKETINTLNEAIGREETARKAADATLQTNIDTVSTTIPEMSVTPDPYKGVERDAQGRALAADPESGATDKTLVTANWVGQTGAGRPNNLIHEYGEEYVYGPKIFKRPSYDGVRIQNDTQSINVIPTQDREYNTINFYDVDSNFMGKISMVQLANSKACRFDIWLRNNDGTFSKIALGSGS